jgi:glycosyltransferase involved in cell wall biosynthesis
MVRKGPNRTLQAQKIMKILVVRSSLPDMGPGTQPLTIARDMRNQGHETVFATAGGSYAPVVEEAGFPVRYIPELAHDRHDPLSALGAIRKLSALIRAEAPDVVHGHNAAATILAFIGGLLAGRRIPCVTSVRGVEERESHQWRNGIWKRVPGILLGVCEKTRQRLLSFGCPPGKIHVTYNGIDLARFDRSRYDGAEIRRQFGLKGKLVVGTIGAMTGPEDLDGPGKGQHHLVRAAALLRDAHPDLRVLLVGDGPLRHKVEQTAAELGMEDAVVFAGRRFDTPEMLSAMDIYALPSIHGEFFPNSIIEAMSFALPWIGSDIAGLSELTADGEAGWVVTPGDYVALAERLRLLADDPALRSRRGLRGLREVEERFTIGKVAARIFEGYRRAGLSQARAG